MLRIGIVGAENSHSLAIARTLNVRKAIPGVRVTALWGETDEFARKTAEGGEIPTVVRRPQDMIGAVDAAVVDHRHARFHLPAARAFLRAGLPLFIDKPLCMTVAEGRRFLAEAARRRVPVVSFSVMPLAESFAEFRREVAKSGPLQSLTTSGPSDIHSPYGGVYFYAIHQAEAVVRLLGLEATDALLNPSGSGGTATVWFKGGVVATMNLLPKNCPGFHATAVCDKAVVSRMLPSDPDPYLTGIRSWVGMFRGKRPLYTAREMLAPIAILEALAKSLRTGRKAKVPRV
ncbi:MAG TPA: Gfo/Idh/MocA family oxidoreductase [Planctomycetota bacterium]|nr:Gfo/Idh/MocA family oxidoreductase [Planctomycetota bacterium]